MVKKKKKKSRSKPLKEKSLKKFCNFPERNAGSLKGNIKASLPVITCIFFLFASSLEIF